MCIGGGMGAAGVFQVSSDGDCPANRTPRAGRKASWGVCFVLIASGAFWMRVAGQNTAIFLRTCVVSTKRGIRLHPVEVG